MAKLDGTGTENAQGADGRSARWQNPIEAHVKTLSSDDMRNSAFMAWTYQLPFMRDKKRGLAKLVGGWSFSGVFRVDQGRPLNIFMANDMGGILFNPQKRPNRAGGEGTTSGSFDPNADRYLSSSGWTDPGSFNFEITVVVDVGEGRALRGWTNRGIGSRQAWTLTRWLAQTGMPRSRGAEGRLELCALQETSLDPAERRQTAPVGPQIYPRATPR